MSLTGDRPARARDGLILNPIRATIFRYGCGAETVDPPARRAASWSFPRYRDFEPVLPDGFDARRCDRLLWRIYAADDAFAARVAKARDI